MGLAPALRANTAGGTGGDVVFVLVLASAEAVWHRTVRRRVRKRPLWIYPIHETPKHGATAAHGRVVA